MEMKKHLDKWNEKSTKKEDAIYIAAKKQVKILTSMFC